MKKTFVVLSVLGLCLLGGLWLLTERRSDSESAALSPNSTPDSVQTSTLIAETETGAESLSATGNAFAENSDVGRRRASDEDSAAFSSASESLAAISGDSAFQKKTTNQNDLTDQVAPTFRKDSTLSRDRAFFQEVASSNDAESSRPTAVSGYGSLSGNASGLSNRLVLGNDQASDGASEMASEALGIPNLNEAFETASWQTSGQVSGKTAGGVAEVSGQTFVGATGGVAEASGETFGADSGASLQSSSESSSGAVTSGTASDGGTGGFLLDSKEAISVRGILNRMVSAYRNAQTYRDEGEIRISWNQNGNFHERSSSYRTNFQRPNRLFMDVNGTSVLANGEILCAYTPEMPGALLQKKCPHELQIADILCEQEINWALMDVESSAFSCIPPPLLLLLHQEPLATFFYQTEQSNIRLLANATTEGRDCFRISVLRQGEETVLWIDSETFVLRRVELPRQLLQKSNLVGDAGREEIAVNINFHRAELNWSGVIEVSPPTNCAIVSSFTEPQKQLLGKRVPDMKFTKLNGSQISLHSATDRAFFVYFWSIYETNTLNFQEIDRLYSKFQSNDKIFFLGVNIDPLTVSNEKISQFAEKTGIRTPLARDMSGIVAETLRNGEIFTCFLIDQKGIVQFCDSLGMFHPASRYEQMICDVLDGQNIYLRWINELNRSEQEYRASLRRWIENGVFLKDAHTEKISIPGKKTEKASKPVSCQLTEVWHSQGIRSPSALLPLPSQNRLLVLENGQTVVELNDSGRILVRRPLALSEDEYFYRISTANSSRGERYFVLEGNRIYVFDQSWKKIMVYPGLEQSEQIEPVCATLTKDLDGDGEPEIYAAFRNGSEIRRISLDGKTTGKAGGVSNVFKIAAVRVKNEYELRVIDESGSISVFSPKEMRLKAVLSVPERSLIGLSAFDFDGDGNDELAGSALGEHSQFKAVGLTLDAREIWSIDLSDLVYPRRLEKVYPFFFKSENRIQTGWALVGPDSSVYLVESGGMLIDQFHFGKIISGCVSAVLNGKPFLFLASPDGVTALEISH